jgi:hypothetical protein
MLVSLQEGLLLLALAPVEHADGIGKHAFSLEDHVSNLKKNVKLEKKIAFLKKQKNSAIILSYYYYDYRIQNTE